MVKIQTIQILPFLLYCSNAVYISSLSKEQIDGVDQNLKICARDGVQQRDLAKRAETTTGINGATVIVATAVGVWTTVTIGSCGAFAWTAGANLPSWVMCAAGMTVALVVL